MKRVEAQEQEAFFEWAAYAQQMWPELQFMFHIPNGGRRDARTGAILKRQGVKRGVPDIYLPCARGGYHGLFIEMKTQTTRPTRAQKEFLEYADGQKYLAVVCRSAAEAIDVVREYMKGGAGSNEPEHAAV